MTKDDIKARSKSKIEELIKEQTEKNETNPLDKAYNEEFAKAINSVGDEIQIIINKEEIVEKIPIVVIQHLIKQLETVSKQRETEYETATVAGRAKFNGYIMGATVLEKDFRSVMSEFAAISARSTMK